MQLLMRQFSIFLIKLWFRQLNISGQMTLVAVFKASKVWDFFFVLPIKKKQLSLQMQYTANITINTCEVLGALT